MNRRIAAGTLSMIMALSAMIPVSAEEGTTDKPYEGTEITMVTTLSGPIRAAQNNLEEFEEQTGIKVNFEIYEFQEAINKVQISAAGGGGDIDVICYRPVQETTTWYENGYFEVLNDYIEAAGDDYNYNDFFESAREATQVDGNIVGIPYLMEGEILWYNKDLFEKYDVEVPTTFDELLEVAEACYDPDNNSYGIALRGEGNGAVTQFSGFLYGFGGDFYDEEGNATMNTPEALAALEYYAKLIQYGPDGMAALGQTESVNWFNQGLTAMRIDAYSQTFNHTDPEQSTISDKVGYAMFPEGPIGESTPYNTVAWAYGISSSSQNKEAAWEFIKWISSPEMEVQGMLESGWSARASAWADERVQEYLDPELAEVVAEIGEVGKPYDRPHNANSAEVRAIVGQMIDLANSGLTGDELKAEVDPLNDQIQEILDSEKE